MPHYVSFLTEDGDSFLVEVSSSWPENQEGEEYGEVQASLPSDAAKKSLKYPKIPLRLLLMLSKVMLMPLSKK
ncbi:MAG: hypothetical protein HC875_27015 [Anaerolineales bacterium]|nr:hypothetical protein [Anaerolineales bacterium]